MTLAPVTYPVSLSDLITMADAAAELDGMRMFYVDRPDEQQRISRIVSGLHDIAERAANHASGLIYQEDDGGCLDYDAVKKYYFDKGASDPFGRGRFESAFFHTVRMVYELGLRHGSAKAAADGDCFSAGDMADGQAKAFRAGHNAEVTSRSSTGD